MSESEGSSQSLVRPALTGGADSGGEAGDAFGGGDSEAPVAMTSGTWYASAVGAGDATAASLGDGAEAVDPLDGCGLGAMGAGAAGVDGSSVSDAASGLRH